MVRWSILQETFQQIYGRPAECLAQAPGRIEFIGNHTDYNGGTVMGAAINRFVSVAVAPRSDGTRQFFSDLTGTIEALPPGDATRQSGDRAWLNYPLGIIDTLPLFGLYPPAGFDFLATSDLPAGSGLSSSAALELASALALLALTGQSGDVDRQTLVQMAKHAENHFVGVPCGILDQGVSGFGKVHHLVWIDCQGPSFTTVPLPPHAHFWIVNTHTKHALVDGLYAERHRECMEAAQILGVALLAAANAEQVAAARGKLSHAQFSRALHVVEEISRVAQAVEALRRGDLEATGRLLTDSHRSSQHLFGNSTPELDFLVDRLTGERDVYGARLSGGGFGGAIMALTNGAFGEVQASRIAQDYAARFGEQPEVLHLLTSDGARLL